MRLALLSLVLLAACIGDSPSDDDDDDKGDDAADDDGDGFDADSDCDDEDPDINPDADEVCDGVDNNCDGTVDDDAVDRTTFFMDGDGDGYGDADLPLEACEQPEDAVDNDGDCDDNDDDVNPDASEVCDGEDNDCDGSVDNDAEDALTWYRDSDEDGFGDPGREERSCEQPDGYVDNDQDCDDDTWWINPDGDQYCLGIDTDCDAATTDSGMVSFVDPDGYLYDVTADFEGGTAESPLPITLEDDGTWYFCDSTWYVELDIVGDVDLVGLYGAETSVLSGGGQNTIITLETAGADFTMTEMTLQDGVGTATALDGYLSAGGAIACVADVGVVVEASTIVDNEAEMGGGIFGSSCDLTVRNTLMSGNEASYGGAIGMHGGLATVESVTFEGNSAGVSGGAVFFEDLEDVVDGIFEDVVFSGNTAKYGGGLAALSYQGNYTEVELAGSGTGFFGNSATNGGGFYVNGEAVVTTSGIEFGTGGDANDPDDISLNYGAASYSELGSGVSLTCDATSCE